MLATQLLINATRFPLPRDNGTPRHWNLGTLEPRVHRERKGHRPENRQWGHRPQGNGLKWFRYPPWQSPAVSPLRVSLPSRSRRLRRPRSVHRWLQVQFLVSLSLRLQGQALSFNEEAVFNTGVNAPKRRLMPFEQRLMPLESFSQLKGMKV